jgi:DNA-binding transcriptional MerR regulator
MNYSVGELAKFSGATIRTIQYYDKIGLLTAKRNDNNNLRYYTEKDLVKLQQILFYKKLGMPLKEIKMQCLNYESQDDLKLILDQQKDFLFKKEMEIKTNIAVIDAILSTMEICTPYDLEAMMKLTLKLNNAAILEYKTIEFGSETRTAFNVGYPDYDKILVIYWKWKKLLLEAFSLKENQISPESEPGYQFGKKWHEFVRFATDDNQDMIEAYSKSLNKSELWPKEDKFLMDFCDDYIDRAHQYYCKNEE